MMATKQALTWATTKLKTISPTSSLDAEVLLSFVLKKPKEFLYTNPETNLTKPQQKNMKKLVNRRCLGEPVSYLVGHKEFYGLDFYVDKRVLVPRPETELLVEEILKQLTVNYQLSTVSIADIGTGSGCIIIALAKSYKLKACLPAGRAISYYATDISNQALQVAKKNAKKHKVKIKFFQGNLLEPLKNNKIDILIANLPYGEKSWKNNWVSAEACGLKHEPQKALFTKENGLYLYRCLFKQIAERKQKPKLIIGEFDPRQKIGLQKLTKKYLPEYLLEIKKDLARLNRIFTLSLD